MVPSPSGGLLAAGAPGPGEPGAPPRLASESVGAGPPRAGPLPGGGAAPAVGLAGPLVERMAELIPAWSLAGRLARTAGVVSRSSETPRNFSFEGRARSEA